MTPRKSTQKLKISSHTDGFRELSGDGPGIRPQSQKRLGEARECPDFADTIVAVDMFDRREAPGICDCVPGGFTKP